MEIKDWTLSGGGMEGESYISASHPEFIMKVYTFNRPESFVEDEFRQAKALQDCGVSTPRAIEKTEFNGCPAIIYQRITNKKSFCRLAGERPELMPDLAVRMAAMARELHSKPADGSFPGALDKYRNLLASNTVIDADAKSAVLKAINDIAADDRPTLLHGDLHFGNIITDGRDDWFIDMGDVSCGHPNHDLAMFYITTHYGSEPSFNSLYHLSWDRALEFWNLFKRSYYGRDIPDEDIHRELRNYMLARAVWFKHEQIQTSLCSILCADDSPVVAEIKLDIFNEQG